MRTLVWCCLLLYFVWYPWYVVLYGAAGVHSFYTASDCISSNNNSIQCPTTAAATASTPMVVVVVMARAVSVHSRTLLASTTTAAVRTQTRSLAGTSLVSNYPLSSRKFSDIQSQVSSQDVIVKRAASGASLGVLAARSCEEELVEFGRVECKLAEKTVKFRGLVENWCGSADGMDLLITQLNKIPNGQRIGMEMKQAAMDGLTSSKKKPDQTSSSASYLNQLRGLEKALKVWIATVFHYDSVYLKTITFDTASGQLLEKVASAEAVHRVRSLSELKRRLHNGRQCFALFHHNIPNDPIAFLHVAFTPMLAPSLRYLNTVEEIQAPSHAIFYSVNSPIPALSTYIFRRPWPSIYMCLM
jgi:hypothetical protein